MNVFVTGLAGFIGSHLADALLADGHKVVGIDDLTTGSRDNIPDGAWCHEEPLEELGGIEGYDLIIHCAASYSDPRNWHRDVMTNVLGAQVVAASGIPTVYFQTVLPPTSSYAISKIAGEQYLRLSTAPLAVFRLANIYGPRNLSGPIPTFYRRISTGQPCTVVNTQRDFVYIDDLVRYVIGKLGQPGDYTVASGQQQTVMTVYNLVAALLDSEDDPVMAERQGDDIAAMPLTPAPDFHPTTLFGLGVDQAVRWYATHGVTNTYTHLRSVPV